MVRISDILKQKGKFPEANDSPIEKKKEEKPTHIPASGEPPEEKRPVYKQKEETRGSEGTQIAKIMGGAKSEAEKEMQIVKAMHQVQLDPEESARAYQRAMDIIKEILDTKQKSPDSISDLKEAYEIVKIIVDRMVLGDKELIILTARFSDGSYLYAHLVNVCILSVDIGLYLGYNKSKLNELGLGAYLHDLGMAEMMAIAGQPRRLNTKEYKKIKQHPIYGGDMLSAVKNIHEEVIAIVKQEHERVNGSGYPEGLKDDQIHEYAKIVGVVDVYEALVHPRSYRDALNPHDAIKELLSMNSSMLFETKILKLLINRVGLYPVGCWVELNTGEIGKVCMPNEDSPLRPKINIIFSPEKTKLPQMKSMDLSQHTNLYIKRSINPQELGLKFE